MVEVARSFVEVWESLTSILSELDVLAGFADLAANAPDPYARPQVCVRACVLACVSACVRACVRACVCACVYALACPLVCTCMHAGALVHTAFERPYTGSAELTANAPDPYSCLYTQKCVCVCV